MITTLLLFVLNAYSQPETIGEPTLLIRVLQPEQLQNIEVQIKRGQQVVPLTCGDGQEYSWDAVEDGVLTCAYFNPINIVEHIRITSKSISTPIFDGAIQPGTDTRPELSYNISKQGSRWTANRVALHQTNVSIGAMTNSWEWLIGFWCLFIANILGWVWWNNK